MSVIIIYACFIFSGMSGLIFEVSWSKALSLLLGHSIYSISTVVGAYMAGLGIGALIAGTFLIRLRYPLRAYGFIEGVVGLFGFSSLLLFKLMQPVFSALFILHESYFALYLFIRFIIIFCILLIPTTAMGMTLPLLVSAMSEKRIGFGSVVARLYGLNTVGAVLGTLLAGFVLLPLQGLFMTIMSASALNCVIMLIIYAIPSLRQWKIDASLTSLKMPEKISVRTTASEKSVKHAGKILLILFAFSGFLSLVYEVGWTRILSPIIGSSVYSFSIILATFLLGIALGSLVIARWSERVRKPFLIFGILEILLGLTAMAGTFSFYYLPEIFVSIIQKSGLRITWIVLGEFLLAGFISFFPCLIMGFLFPVASCAYKKSESSPGRNVGRIYFFNTFGAIFGSLMTGFILIPFIGILKTLIIASVASVFIGIIAFLLSEISLRIKIIFSVVIFSLTIVLTNLAPSWDINRMNRGFIQILRDVKTGDLTGGVHKQGQILYYEEGKNANVAVSYVGSDIYLKIAGKVDATAVKDATTQILCAQLPLLYADHPKDVCIIGLGSGITTHSVLTHPVQTVETIEIEEAVVEAAKYFTVVNHDPLSDPRSMIVLDDARNYLSYVDKKYDVIISEPSNPWIAGINSLFTQEFYDIIHEKLNDGGVFSQWIQSYELSVQSYATILRTFHSKFPHSHFYFIPESGDSLMIAAKDSPRLSFQYLSAFIGNRKTKEDLRRIDIVNPFDLAHYYIAPLSEIVGSFGEGPINTDDNSYIEYKVPFELFSRSSNEFQIDVSGNLINAARLTFFSDLNESHALLGMALSSLKRKDEIKMDLILTHMKTRRFESEVSRLISAIQEREEEREKEQKAYRLFKKADEALQRKDGNLAYRYTVEALTLKPDLDDLSFNAALLFLTIGKLEEAEQVFKSIIKRKPFSYTYASFLNLGSIYWNRRQLNRGLDYYEEAIRYNPYLADAYIRAANAHIFLGNSLKARKNIERALQLEPANMQARELLKAL